MSGTMAQRCISAKSIIHGISLTRNSFAVSIILGIQALAVVTAKNRVQFQLRTAPDFLYIFNPSSANLSGSDFLSRRRSLPCCGRGRGRFFVIVLQRSYCLTGTNLAEVILNVLFRVIGVSE